MGRLIDADAAIRALNVASRGDSKDVIRNLVICFLLASPTVDAVPVIRCKDCKFSMSGIDKNSERYILCQLHERSYGVTDDGFCMWAERKEE